MLSDDEIEFFQKLETSLHTKEVRNSPEKVAALIADDFVEFGKSGGVYHKEDTLKSLAGEQTDLQIVVSEFDAKALAPTVVLVTYRATMIDTDTLKPVTTLRSSMWVEREGLWQMVFHQGTKAQA